MTELFRSVVFAPGTGLLIGFTLGVTGAVFGMPVRADPDCSPLYCREVGVIILFVLCVNPPSLF